MRGGVSRLFGATGAMPGWSGFHLDSWQIRLKPAHFTAFAPERHLAVARTVFRVPLNN